jgi:ATP-dependent Lon protease
VANDNQNVRHPSWCSEFIEPAGFFKLSQSEGGLILPGHLEEVYTGKDLEQGAVAKTAEVAVDPKTGRPLPRGMAPLTVQGIHDQVPADVRGMHRTFTEERILAADKMLSSFRSGDQVRFRTMLTMASRNGGWRTLPWAKRENPFSAGPSWAAYRNFEEVRRSLALQWTCAARAKDPGKAMIQPMLLVGKPGVGKTHFARGLSSAMGVPFQVFSAGVAHEAFQLSGSDQGYTNSKPGIVFSMLTHGESAAPILVVDEVDKINPDSSGQHNSPINALLDLTDVGTAARWFDNHVNMTMDASRLVVIMTANDPDAVPEALRSRLNHFDIEAPDAEQIRLICQMYLDDLQRDYHTPGEMRFEESSLGAAMSVPDTDIRGLRRAILESFAAALEANRRDVVVGQVVTGRRRRPVGFLS